MKIIKFLFISMIILITNSLYSTNLLKEKSEFELGSKIQTTQPIKFVTTNYFDDYSLFSVDNEEYFKTLKSDERIIEIPAPSFNLPVISLSDIRNIYDPLKVNYPFRPSDKPLQDQYFCEGLELTILKGLTWDLLHSKRLNSNQLLVSCIDAKSIIRILRYFSEIDGQDISDIIKTLENLDVNNTDQRQLYAKMIAFAFTQVRSKYSTSLIDTSNVKDFGFIMSSPSSCIYSTNNTDVVSIMENDLLLYRSVYTQTTFRNYFSTNIYIKKPDATIDDIQRYIDGFSVATTPDEYPAELTNSVGKEMNPDIFDDNKIQKNVFIPHIFLTPDEVIKQTTTVNLGAKEYNEIIVVNGVMNNLCIEERPILTGLFIRDKFWDEYFLLFKEVSRLLNNIPIFKVLVGEDKKSYLDLDNSY